MEDSKIQGGECKGKGLERNHDPRRCKAVDLENDLSFEKVEVMPVKKTSAVTSIHAEEALAIDRSDS